MNSHNIRKKQICLVVTNDITNDYRILKEAETLSKKFKVIILGFIDNNKKRDEIINKIKIIRVNALLFRKIILKLIPNFRRFTIVSNNNINNKFNLISDLKIIINDLIMFLLFLNRNISIFKGLFQTNSDIYQANDIDTLIAVYIYTKFKNKKMTYDSHELCVDDGFFKTKFFKKILFLIEKYIARRVSAVITVNIPIAKILKKRYSLQNLPYIIKNLPNYEEIISIYNINEPIKILYLGVFTPGRGLEEVIKSMKYIDNVILYFRGFGPSEFFLKKMVKDLKLSHKIIFLKKVKPNKVISSSSRFDVGIMPIRASCLSYYYCSPNKLYQYMMSGLAVLGSDLPEIKKLIEKEKIGLTFNPNNPSDIAKAIKKISSDKRMILEYKKKSISSAKKYSWETQIDNFLEIYTKI